MLRAHVLHLRPHQLPALRRHPTDIFFSGSTKFNPLLFVLEFYGACARNIEWQLPIIHMRDI